MLEPRLPYLPRKADQRLRGPVLSCRALSAALLAQVTVSSCDHRVFGDRCADDARKTVNEWCNDAWSRTTVVAPRRDNTYTGGDCSSPDAVSGDCFPRVRARIGRWDCG